MSWKWCKLGRIYNLPADGLHPRLLSHVANPLPVRLEGNVYRIFFSARDSMNRSSVGAVDYDLVRREVLVEHKEPFFTCGPEGSFYSNGVSIGCCYTALDGIRYIPFMGWRALPGEHWRGEIGRLILTNDMTVELESEEPFMGIDDVDPVSLSYPWVTVRRKGKFQMWYGSTVTWDAGNGEMLHVLKGAISKDGNQWSKVGLAVPYKIGEAQAFSRPTVIESENEKLTMWYSYRSGDGTSYRIGSAESLDGLEWSPAPAGIDVSAAGWDSEMVEYPCVFLHKKKWYMLYNGSGFGKTGFGIAVLESENEL